MVVDITSSMNIEATSGAGYAIYDAQALKDHPRTLVLLNFQDISGASIPYTIPSGSAQSSKGQVSVTMLAAPSLSEKTAITYNGQTVNGQGELTGTAGTTTAKCSKGCSIQIPGPGAAIIAFGETTGGSSKKSDGAARHTDVVMILLGGLSVVLFSILCF